MHGRSNSENARNDEGFSLIEVMVVMVIIAVHGVIGFQVYTGIIGDARGTALDANIKTAAEALELEASLDPTILDGAGDIEQAMTATTNFVWNSTWDSAGGDTPDIVRFEILGDGAAATTSTHPTSGGTAPTVGWLSDGDSAVRIHMRNPEGEWRCALLVHNISLADIAATGYANTTSVTDDDREAANRISGVWYDGGTSQPASQPAGVGIHDCSPVPDGTPTPPTAGTSSTLGDTCATASFTVPASPVAPTATEWCFPDDAITWEIPAGGAFDETSTAVASYRTLHRSPSALDSN